MSNTVVWVDIPVNDLDRAIARLCSTARGTGWLFMLQRPLTKLPSANRSATVFLGRLFTCGSGALATSHWEASRSRE